MLGAAPAWSPSHAVLRTHLCANGSGAMTTKKVIGWLAVLFVLFFIVTQPTQAANIVSTLWQGIVNIAHGVSDFVTSL
jgi:hypothetical protein